LIGTDGTPTQPAWAATTAYTAGTMIVDSNGNVEECTTAGSSGSTAPTWATVLGQTTTDSGVTWTLVALAPAYKFAGALEAVTDIEIGAKVEEVMADQETLPVDAVMTGEADAISVTMKESDAAKLQLIIPHGTYATGTDGGLPSGAQTYEEIAFGGLPGTGVPKFGVLFISKRKDVSNKFVATILYRAYQKTATKLPVQRAKETVYKVDFQAIADENRPAGDRGGKIYRQT
jgi:hypothetical protein